LIRSGKLAFNGIAEGLASVIDALHEFGKRGAQLLLTSLALSLLAVQLSADGGSFNLI
jgi:hypothetical protein